MKLRLVTLLSTVLLGAAAFAQTTPIGPRLTITRVDDPNIDTFTFGASSCSDTITLRWANTFAVNAACPTAGLALWASSGSSCPSAPNAGDLTFTNVDLFTVSQIRQGTFTLRISELPDFKNAGSSDAGTLLPCGSATPFTRTHVVCGSLEQAVQSGFGCGTPTKLAATPLKLVYDTLPPSRPTIDKVTAQDQAVRVEFSVDSDTSAVLIETLGPTDLDYVARGETASTNTFVRAENLQNSVPYQVRIRARDAAGNVSEPSDPPIEVTPIRTLGFWGYYKDVGGTDTGGCSTGLGLSPLLLIALALRRARKQG